MSRLVGMIGWFAQDGIRLNTNPRSDLPEIYNPRGARFMFSGVILMEDDDTFSGSMTDRCGEAAINGQIVGAVLVFTKQYLHRRNEIKYRLTLLQQAGMHFKGQYRGKAVGSGDAQVTLVTLPQSFFG